MNTHFLRRYYLHNLMLLIHHFMYKYLLLLDTISLVSPSSSVEDVIAMFCCYCEILELRH
jgi:hypothetical protein